MNCTSLSAAVYPGKCILLRGDGAILTAHCTYNIYVRTARMYARDLLPMAYILSIYLYIWPFMTAAVFNSFTN